MWSEVTQEVSLLLQQRPLTSKDVTLLYIAHMCCVWWLPSGRPSFMCTAMNKKNISLSVALPLMERIYQLIANGVLTAHRE